MFNQEDRYVVGCENPIVIWGVEHGPTIKVMTLEDAREVAKDDGNVVYELVEVPKEETSLGGATSKELIAELVFRLTGERKDV